MKRSARSGGNMPARISRTPRSRRPAPSRSGSETASTSGPTARGSIFSAPISRSCSNCRSRTSRSSIWRAPAATRTEEHTSELQSRSEIVCRLQLENKKKKRKRKAKKKKKKKQKKKKKKKQKK